MFNNRKRVDAAFAKGLMFGKAVGARDEHDRIVNLLQTNYQSVLDSLDIHYGLAEADILIELLERIERKSK